MRVTHYQKITIIKTAKPVRKNLNEELQWLGSSLGLFNLRDKDRSCFRIFIEMLKSAKKGKVLSSDELAKMLNLSRGTVVHHINKLMESGLVISTGNKYSLRVENLEVLIEELRKDLERSIDDLKDIAGDIDQALGL